MKNDKRGSGMLESMVAMMVVIIALTAFMGMFCYYQMNDEYANENDFEFVKKLEIRDGKITGDVQEDLAYLVESNCYSKVELKVNVVGDVNCSEFTDSFGEIVTDNVDSFKGTFNIASDDGRSLLANYEVIIWS